MKKSKFTNEMIELMIATYNPDASDDERREQVKQLADKFGMSTRQIIGKLSTMPDRVTYQPYAAKAPKPRKATNMEIVRQIADNIGATVDELASLERASKAALNSVLSATAPADES